LLKDDSLTPTERLAAIYVLLEFSRQNDMVFVSALCEFTEQSESIAERILLQEWLSGRDFSGYSANQAIHLTGEFKELEVTKKSRVVRPLVNPSPSTKDTCEILGRYETEYLRPLPDLLDIRPIEAKWVTPGFIPTLLWDLDLNDIASSSRELLTQAFKETLNTEQLNAFRDTIDTYPEVLQKLRLTPENFTKLVMTNTELAGDLLVLLHNSPNLTDYFMVLVDFKVCSQSMELMYRLVNEMDIPSEVIETFLKNSIISCEDIKEADVQMRHVRLLCLLVVSLLSNSIIEANNLTRELLDLGSKFQNLPEVDELFRVLDSSPK
jgi:hypothetical protein